MSYYTAVNIIDKINVHVSNIIQTVIDCGAPSFASGVTIDPFKNTKFGALITFHCEESNNSMTAVCGSDGEWFPNPASIKCGNGMYSEEGLPILYYYVCIYTRNELVSLAHSFYTCLKHHLIIGMRQLYSSALPWIQCCSYIG